MNSTKIQGLSLLFLVMMSSCLYAEERPRARDLGVPFDGTLGSNNAITDAPLAAHQLKHLAHRTSLGIGRNGSVAGYMSGEIILAFSTANNAVIGQQMQTLESPTA